MCYAINPDNYADSYPFAPFNRSEPRLCECGDELWPEDGDTCPKCMDRIEEEENEQYA